MPKESKDTIICNVSSSINSLLSSLTSFTKDFILDLFPNEFFKEIFIATSSTVNQQTKTDDLEDIPINKYPLLSISPSVNLDFDDVTGGPFPIWRRGVWMLYKDSYRRYGYKPIFSNDSDNIYISVIPNRIKFSFECKIRVESIYHRDEIAFILRQKLHNNDKFFYNNQNIQCPIPNIIIQALSNCKNFNLTNNDDKYNLIEYLQKFSPNHIEYCKNHLSGLNNFIFNYPSNLLINVTSPPEVDGREKEMNNMSMTYTNLNFTLDIESWIPFSFLFQCNNLPKGEYNSMVENLGKVNLYTSINLQPDNSIGDKHLLLWTKFITSENETIDRLYFNDFMKSREINFINHIINNSSEIEILNDIFLFLIYKNRTRLVFEKDYRINWKKGYIELLNPNKNDTYNLGFYGLEKELYEFNENLNNEIKKDLNNKRIRKKRLI